MECAVESVQSAKRNEFPVAPEQKKKSKKWASRRLLI
jgi:hypothetical protein